MAMKSFTAVVERCPETRLCVGYVPGFPGAHTQGATLDELQANLEEVIGMFFPRFQMKFGNSVNSVIPSKIRRRS
jgi:predicted RNase H-like HicB family nuclease